MPLVFALQAAMFVFLVLRTHQQIRWIATEVHADARLAERLRELVGSGRNDSVGRWLELTRGSWLGCVAGAALGPADPGLPVDDAMVDFQRGFRARLYVVDGAGRMTSVCTLLAILVELSWGLAGGSGLESLQAGLPQQIAFRNVLVSLALGLVTLGVYMWGRRRLCGRVVQTMKTLRSLATELESDLCADRA